MNILRAAQSPVHQQGSFRIRRVRPGAILGDGTDPALGPLSAFDHADLGVGTVVRMHEHRNDEILSYMWRGTMLHEDRSGHRVSISAAKLMMMSAGASFWHEERTPEEAVEMLQIFVRPREADLPSAVTFLDRPNGAPVGAWGLIAGPEDSGAPLTIRNAVQVRDARLREGQELEVPAVPGLTPFLYVIDGAIEVGCEAIGKGDAVSGADHPLPPIRAAADSGLVLFLVDRAARSSRAGTISGH